MTEPYDLSAQTPAEDFPVPNHKATRQRRDKATPRERKPTVTYRSGMFVRPLTEMYGAVGMVLAPFDQHCAQAFMMNAQSCAEAMDEWARDNESVRRVLSGLVTTSVLGKVIVAHAPLLAAIAVHHSGRVQGLMSSGFGDKVESMMKGETASEE